MSRRSCKPKGFQRIAFLDDAASHLVDKKVIEAVDDAVEKVIVNDDLKKKYLSLAGQVVRLYKAILPDPKANEFAPIKTCLAVLAEKIRSFTEEASIEDLMEKVGELLDESIATKGYVIHATEESSLIDLSQIDFEALKAHFEKGRKHTEAEKLKGAISKKLHTDGAVEQDPHRPAGEVQEADRRVQQGMDVDGFFEKLMTFAKELSEEDQAGRCRATDRRRTGDLRHPDEARRSK